MKTSPVARRLADEHGLELEDVEGTGPGGRILKRDVEAAARGRGGDRSATAVADPGGPGTADGPPKPTPGPGDGADPAKSSPAPSPKESPPPASPEEASQASVESDGAKGSVTEETLSRLQQTVARRMAESKATVPDFALETDVDMDEAVALRRQLEAAVHETEPTPSFNDLVVKASALALRAFPRANGAYRDGSIELHSRINVGVAVATSDGLLVPTIFDADSKTPIEIARETRALAQQVRAGKITPSELSGGTFTVSNLGMFGITSFAAVINPPQAAILAVGAIQPTPVARDGEIGIRHVMRLTLTCDHRILYGADAARFLGRIRSDLEEPIVLLAA